MEIDRALTEPAIFCRVRPTSSLAAVTARRSESPDQGSGSAFLVDHAFTPGHAICICSLDPPAVPPGDLIGATKETVPAPPGRNFILLAQSFPVGFRPSHQSKRTSHVKSVVMAPAPAGEAKALRGSTFN